MPKYVVYSETKIGNFSYPKKDMSDAEVLKVVQACEPQHGWQTIKRLPRGSHLCKYCGDIAEGTYADLLCPDCRETFGHSLYSEL